MIRPLQQVNPVIVMQFSDDGGFTWSNERTAHIGRQGQRSMTAKWNRLGMSTDRVYRFTMTDPVKVVLLGATAEVVSE